MRGYCDKPRIRQRPPNIFTRHASQRGETTVAMAIPTPERNQFDPREADPAQCAQRPGKIRD